MVQNTNIFARAVGERQLVAYSMSVAATEPVAMILPLPLPPRSPEDALRFIDLSRYARFFVDLDAAFPPLMMLAPASAPRASGGGGGPIATLKVHRVGRFEATFVPSLSDFARIDARFRITDDVWSGLPRYADYGFAVFKLLDLGGGLFGPRKRTIHPMAFEFPRRDPRGLFFPTLHVHDGSAAAEADFDHALYYQDRDELGPHSGWWQTANKTAAQALDLERAGGLVDAELPLRRVMMQGRFANQDTVLQMAA